MFKLKAARTLCDAFLKECKESTYNWQNQRQSLRESKGSGGSFPGLWARPKTWYRDHDDLRQELHLEFQDAGTRMSGLNLSSFTYK